MSRVVEPSKPDDHLLERILSRENMLRAWKRVKANTGAAGVDGMSIEQFPDAARTRLIEFSNHLVVKGVGEKLSLLLKVISSFSDLKTRI